MTSALRYSPPTVYNVASKSLCYGSVFLLFLMMCNGVLRRTVCPSAMRVAAGLYYLWWQVNND